MVLWGFLPIASDLVIRQQKIGSGSIFFFSPSLHAFMYINKIPS